MPSDITTPGTAMPADRLALAETAVRGAGPSVGAGLGGTYICSCSCVADDA